MTNDFLNLSTLLQIKPPKRKVFVSFHHDNDQGAYNVLKHFFLDKYEVFEDHSVGRQLVDSRIMVYVDWAVRERFIKGTSVTIVLCGSETYKRKFVDWEINSTLLGKRALLGIILPSAIRNFNNQFIVPNRLADNISSGYAHYDFWANCTGSAEKLNMAIEFALLNSKNSSNMDNSFSKMQRNL